MASIQINILGRFEIIVDGKPIEESLNKSKKSKSLLQYLLLNRGQSVNYYQLYEILWPNEESVNPESALKTLVSRLRSMLGKCSEKLAECILTNAGTYQWNAATDCEIDADRFEFLTKMVLEASSLTPEIRAAATEMLTVYAGDLLPATEQESWLITESMRLHNLYLKVVYCYLSLLRQAGDMDTVIETCRTALDIDAFDERLHVEMLDALVREHKNNEALMQYKLATNLHYRYLGMQPPEGIQAFYKRIVQGDESLESNIDSISDELCASDANAGAFVCEYVIFKDIFHLQMRNLERLNISMFIGLVKLSDVQGNVIDPLVLDELMEKLLRVLRANLRRGDTVARYSASQYALLLPTVNYVTGKMVLDRIKRAFYKESVNSSILFSYRIRPLSAHPTHSAGEHDAPADEGVSNA